MCGIAGFVRFGGHQTDEALVRVKRMADALIHRGPDGEGFYVDGCVALAHRRLAIIDIAGGQQPMGTADGRIQIVFNGEIYNFPELRAELEATGHRFRTSSDTEVILLSYLEWGEQCVQRLAGMFAFAIWDAREKRLFLARDRVGKKPLYYWKAGDVFAFGSELKALRAGGLCSDGIDPESLDCYFSFGYVPAPRTIYRDVKKLRAAHTMTVGERITTEHRYWSLSFASPRSISLEAATEEFESLLDQAVRCRLISEVPLGAFLSGGIDSSLVVSSMARAMNRPVLTNSVGFDERGYNELPAASQIACHLGADHHESTVRLQSLDVIDKIARYFDEPLADSSAVPTWYVCEMTRRSVTVALSGDGGDEAFGGYDFRYVPHMLESRIRRALPIALRGPIFGTAAALWPNYAGLPKPLRLRTIFENLALGDMEAFYRDLIWLRPDAREALYSPDFLTALRGYTPIEDLAPHYASSDAPDALARSQCADIAFYMTDDVLVKVDRMSMAHSLEVRCPLLDHRILEFSARLPSSIKIRGTVGKLPLRQLAAKRLPSQISALPKRGFSIPAGEWLRGELRPMLESVLFGEGGVIADMLNRKELRSLWNQHQHGRRDHKVLLWGLLMLGLWERQQRVRVDVPG